MPWNPAVNVASEWLVRQISGLSYPSLGRKGTVYSLTKRLPDRIPEGILAAVCRKYMTARTKAGVRDAVTKAFEEGFINLEDYDDCIDPVAIQIFLSQEQLHEDS